MKKLDTGLLSVVKHWAELVIQSTIPFIVNSSFKTLTPTGLILCFVVYYLVRGMMYYRKALRLQAFLDKSNDQGVYRCSCPNNETHEKLFFCEMVKIC
jgi:hypothetical protein